MRRALVVYGRDAAGASRFHSFSETRFSRGVVRSGTNSSSRRALTSSNGSLSGKIRVVVLGVGWGGFKVVHDLNLKKCDLTVISPRDHFIFTPLLPTTTVGTLEFRGVIEPVRQARGKGGLRYLQASATHIDTSKKTVDAEYVYDHFDESLGHTVHERVSVSYDKLVIAVGGQPRTFNIPGVYEHTHFLRELKDARKIRNRLLECFERAANPDLPDSERKRLLTFVVVGGGPTCIEFAGELHDFLTADVPHYYPGLGEQVRIVLVEAGERILGTFPEELSEKTTRLYERRRVEVRTNTSVKEVLQHKIILSDDTSLPYGLCVWSTGVGPSAFVENIAKVDGLPVDGRGFIQVGDDLRVVGQPDIFAVGDCAQIEGFALPQTAQVAQQEGRHVARALNKNGGENPGKFKFSFQGMLAYVGGHKALFVAGKDNKFASSGFGTWLLWNAAYITQLVSLRNKMMIPMYWFKSRIFGRDVSQF